MASQSQSLAVSARRQNEDERVLRIVRRFKAPRARVFAAWSDAKQLAKWYGPVDMAIPVAKVNFKVGGEWQTTMRGSQGDHHVSGKYIEINPPERLVFTWAWHTTPHHDAAREHETICIVEFRAKGKDTEMIFEQRLFKDSAGRDNHNKGWTSAFNGLENLLAGKQVKLASITNKDKPVK